MDICGEHGEDIAYKGRDCPACMQVEQLKEDHQEELNSIDYDHQEEIETLNEQIDELENK